MNVGSLGQIVSSCKISFMKYYIPPIGQKRLNGYGIFKMEDLKLFFV